MTIELNSKLYQDLTDALFAQTGPESPLNKKMVDAAYIVAEHYAISLAGERVRAARNTLLTQLYDDNVINGVMFKKLLADEESQ